MSFEDDLAAALQGISANTDPATGGTPYTNPGGTPYSLGGLSSNQQAGRTILAGILRSVGLDTPDLVDYVTKLITGGGSISDWQSTLAADLYDPATTVGKIVDQKYPELQARLKNGYAPASINDVVQYRTTAIQVARAEGLDPTTLDFTKLIGNNVGLPELQTRIRDNYGAVRDALPDVVDQLHTIYNLTPGDIAAMVSDPTPGLSAKLLRKFEASQIAAAGTRTGFGQLDQTDAERLAAMGVTADQAQAGFTRLGQLGELTQPLPGEGVDPVSRAQQLAAQFGGDVAAQKAIEDERALRKAQFAGGGGLSAGRGGFGGLGRTDGT